MSTILYIHQTITIISLMAMLLYVQIPLIHWDHFYSTFKEMRKYHYSPEKSSIFYGILTTPSSPRQKLCTDHWLKDLNNTKHKVAFICDKGNEVPGYKYIHPSKENLSMIISKKGTSLRRNIDRGMKRMIGLEYFLNETDCDYYWTTCDDIAVDLIGVENMITELDREYDPMKDLVFIGQSWGHFLQGGVGVLISRAAALKMYPIRKKWVSEINKEDDLNFDEFREYLGIPAEKTYSPYVFGEEPHKFIQEKFWEKNYPQCTNRSFPASSNYPLCKLNALHPRSTNVYKAVENLIKAKEKISNLYFSYHHQDLTFCYGEKYFSCSAG